MDQWWQPEGSGSWAVDGDERPPLRIPKTAEIVADHLRAQIVSGALAPGDYLPPESVLTAAFGIARPTLREAMRILESEGLLTIARGTRTGARVLRPGLSPLVRHAAMLLRSRHVPVTDLFAARLAFEPEAVAILCAQTPMPSLRRLEDALAAARARLANDDLPGTILHLSAFHLALVEAAGNRTMALFAAALHGLVRAQLESNRGRIVPDARQRRQLAEDSLAASARLLVLLHQCDDTAAAHWRGFLAAANAVLLAHAGDCSVALPSAP